MKEPSKFIDEVEDIMNEHEKMGERIEELKGGHSNKEILELEMKRETVTTLYVIAAENRAILLQILGALDDISKRLTGEGVQGNEKQTESGDDSEDVCYWNVQEIGDGVGFKIITGCSQRFRRKNFSIDEGADEVLCDYCNRKVRLYS